MLSLELWPKAASAETTLHAELVRRGLPAEYARRTADELADHRADLLADLKGDGDAEATVRQRLGETRRLARQIAIAYRQRSWFGRWPLVPSHFLAPLAFATLWLAVSFATAAGLMTSEGLLGNGHAVDGQTWRDATIAQRYCTAVALMSSFLLPTFFAWKACGWLLRRSLSRVAAGIACGAIAVLNGCFLHQTLPCPDDPTLACNSIALFVGRISAADQIPWMVLPVAGTQVAIVLATGLAVLWHDQRRRQQALLAADGAAVESAIAA